MAENGELTITNLGQATGKSDRRLSAHHPDGPGNTTAFGDFFVTSFDQTGFDEGDVPATVKAGDVFSLYIVPTSGGDLRHFLTKDYVVENALVRGPALRVNTNGCQINALNWHVLNSNSTVRGIEIVTEVLRGGQVGVDAIWNDGGINSDTIPNQPVFLSWSANAQNAIVNLTANVSMTPNPGEVQVSYTIEDGTPDYDIKVYQRVEGSTTQWNNLVHTVTRTSNGSYSWTDTGLNPSTSYEYRITVLDSLNDSAAVEPPAITPGGLQ